MNFLIHLFALIPSPSDAPAMYATLAGFSEIAFHAIPSKKPLGWIHLFSDGVHVIGAGLSKIGDVIDKVIPQNLSQ